jgi:hypothetical protein
MRVSKDDLDKARRERNVEFLLRVVRTNSDLPQEVRDYLADILGDLINRKIKRPAHRPAKSETLIRRQRIATRALEIEENAARKKMSQSVAEAAAEFDVSTSFVYGCVAKYGDQIREAWRYQEEAEKAFEDGRVEPDYEPVYPDDFQDYLDHEPTDQEVEEAGERYIELMIDIARGK